MRFSFLIKSLVLAGVLSVSVTSAWAQRTSPDTKRDGTAGASWLLIPSTARTASLGMSATGGVLTMNGIEASFANPASLTLNEGTSALFSRMNYVEDIGINTFGIAQRFGSNQIGLSVQAMSFGDIPLTTEQDPDVDENTPTWTALNVAVGINYARVFTDRIAAGVTAKIVSESMAEDLNASTVAFDAGMSYIVGESGLRFGVSLQNFGPSMAYGGDGLAFEAQSESGQRAARIPGESFELPSMLNFGVTYRRDLGAAAAVTLLGNFRSNSYESDNFSGGLEFALRDILFLRGGYQWQENIDTGIFDGWNMGAGLNLEVSGTRLQVDYAYRTTNLLSAVQMITASVTL